MTDPNTAPPTITPVKKIASDLQSIIINGKIAHCMHFIRRLNKNELSKYWMYWEALSCPLMSKKGISLYMYHDKWI